ncbi:helix-turn-helix domain-containing protein [Streptomyces sp. NPDC055059]|uniref:helix-turn-helix domain-containing protein n=1 Tax=Streptomyces sp. NPDC127172 TaxID=3345382 RepID=UPI00363ACF21
MQLRYSFRLYPTRGQQAALGRAFGCARVVYNDAVRDRRTARENKLPFPRAGELSRRLITEAKKTPQRAWLGEVSSVVLQQSLRDAESAYSNFFASLKGERKGPRIGEPSFKSRKDTRQAIRFTANARWTHRRRTPPAPQDRTEGAEHQRRAGVITQALEAVDQFELARDCERIADQLIDAFADSGRAELMAAFAHALPMRAAVQFCGMPAGSTDTEQLVDDLRISLDAAEGDDPVAAYGRVGARIQQLVKEKRESPGPDVTSRMLAHPAGLTDEEVVQDLISVIAAAQQPTANWICNTLRLLLTDERFALNVSGGRLSVGQALNEVLWLDTPTQNFIGRWAVRDTQLGGRQIRAGDCLVLGLAAANTDPQIWPDSQVGAENSAHLSFSNGEHRCPYPVPLLADVIARTAVETLLERLPDLVLAVEPQELTWRPSIWMRGLTALPVQFTPVSH